jgi:hypothetical protein
VANSARTTCSALALLIAAATSTGCRERSLAARSRHSPAHTYARHKRCAQTAAEPFEREFPLGQACSCTHARQPLTCAALSAGRLPASADLAHEQRGLQCSCASRSSQPSAGRARVASSRECTARRCFDGLYTMSIGEMATRLRPDIANVCRSQDPKCYMVDATHGLHTPSMHTESKNAEMQTCFL